MKPIKGLVFDAYGTLLDVYSIGHLAEQLYPGSGVALSNLWRDKQIEYSRLVSLSDPQPQGSRHYASFWSLTEAALHYSLERLSLNRHEDHVHRLMNQYARLDAFPECQEVLSTLSRSGLPMAVLSNGSPDMLQSALDHAGLSPHLQHLISVDGIRQFKTHPATYALASSALNLPKEHLLFISSNGWDVMGAGWFGFSTCWINRGGLPFETIGPRPTLTGRDLRAVLSAL